MAFKMNARSPLMKTLKGGQKNLPQGLKSAIEAAPGKMMESPAKNMNKGYGTPSPAKSKFTDEIQGIVSKPKEQNLYSQAGIAANNKGKSGAQGQPTAKPKEKAIVLKPKKASLATGSTKKAPKKETLISKESRNPVGELNLAPAPKTPQLTKSKSTKSKPKANTVKVKQTAAGTTLVKKDGGGANKGGTTRKEKVTKNSKKVITKTADTRTVEKTNKDGSSSTKTTKRIGKGRIKGAIKDARLARLDRVAKRQAAKAKGSGKKPGSKTEQFG